MTNFSSSWKSSKDPGKQRKFVANAPLHQRGKFLHSHLSEELSKKFGKRAVRVRKGDKVKIMTGQFKGKSGKIDEVDTREARVYISGIEIQKKDGTKTRYPVTISNLTVTELFEDKKRLESLKRK